MSLRKIRIALATLFMLGLTYFSLDFSGTAYHYVSWMPKLQLVPAVLAVNVVVIAVLVLLTLLFGRIYCSVICPLGVLQDLVDWLHCRRHKNRHSFSRPLTWLRMLMLVLFVVAVIVGIGVIVALLDPYAYYGRIAQNFLQPLWMLVNNVLAEVAESADSYAFYHVDIWVRSVPVMIVAAVSLIFVVVLAWRGGRTYCNTICPVGTVLGALSHFSLFRIEIDGDKCRHCGKCTKNCKASCLDHASLHVDHSRCVTCGNCLGQCHFDALHYTWRRKKKTAVAQTATAKGREQQTVDRSRRSFLIGTSLLAVGAMAQKKKKVDGGLAVIEDKAIPYRSTPITPPGSLSAENMRRRCTGCQLCVSECPNHVLRPSDSLLTFSQPVMEYERGYCRPECNRCGKVCPTGAIRPVSHADKTAIQLGHAVWVKKNCVVLTDEVECGNCARHCPVHAIEMVPSDPNDDTSPTVPAVDESKCIGCGSCEFHCPSRPFPAIYVVGHEVHKEV